MFIYGASHELERSIGLDDGALHSIGGNNFLCLDNNFKVCLDGSKLRERKGRDLKGGKIFCLDSKK